jgi:hypothetical protein
MPRWLLSRTLITHGECEEEYPTCIATEPITGGKDESEDEDGEVECDYSCLDITVYVELGHGAVRTQTEDLMWLVAPNTLQPCFLLMIV